MLHTSLNVCKVEWYFSDSPEKNKIETTYCLIEGATFAEAAENLCNDFGEDAIISMEIFPLEEYSITISESLYNAFKEADVSEVTVCDRTKGCTKYY